LHASFSAGHFKAEVLKVRFEFTTISQPSRFLTWQVCMKLIPFLLCSLLIVGCSPLTGLYSVNFADGWRNFEKDGVHIEVIPEQPRIGYLRLTHSHQAVFSAEQDSRIVRNAKGRWKLDRDTLSIIFKSRSRVIDGKRFPKSQSITRYWFTYLYTDSSKNSRIVVPLDGSKTYHATKKLRY
jgi:hypothetical protein